MPGTFSDSPGQSMCLPCYNGTISGVQASRCSACGAKSVAPAQGMPQCLTCAGASLATSTRTTCVCPAGQFLPDLDGVADPDVPTSTRKCQDCPRGADCRLEGILASNMRALRGWWRKDDRSLAFHRCLLPRHCKGGRYDDEVFVDGSDGNDSSNNNNNNKNNNNNGALGGLNTFDDGQSGADDGAGAGSETESSPPVCNNHRTGPLCAYCVDGYSSTTAYSECEKCPTRATSVVTVIGITMVLVISLVGLYWVVLQADREALSEAEWQHRQRVEWDTHDSLFQAEEVHKKVRSQNVDASLDVGPMRHRNESTVELLARRRAETGLAPVIAKIRSKPSLTYKVKILVGFFQVVVNLAFAVDVPWPETYRNFIETFRFFSFDFLPWKSMSCVSYSTRMLIVALAPIVVFGGS